MWPMILAQVAGAGLNALLSSKASKRVNRAYSDLDRVYASILGELGSEAGRSAMDSNLYNVMSNQAERMYDIGIDRLMRQMARSGMGQEAYLGGLGVLNAGYGDVLRNALLSAEAKRDLLKSRMHDLALQRYNARLNRAQGLAKAQSDMISQLIPAFSSGLENILGKILK